MKYLLDTNVCVHYLRGVFEIDKKINGIGAANCYISEITLAELEFGVENSDPAFREKRRAGLETFLTVFGKRIVPRANALKIDSISAKFKNPRHLKGVQPTLDQNYLFFIPFAP
jgi:tRNA(fMet)-specific endonuclease VapC